MNVHKVFTVINNLFGLNFYDIKVPLSFILFLNIIFINVTTIANIYYANLTNNPKMRPIFAFIDFVQLGWPLIIKNYLMVRSILMKNFDANFERKTVKTFEAAQMKKNQKKFFVYVLVCTLIFITKTVLGTSTVAVIYNFSHFVTTVINASSDFIFVYQISCLKDHIKFIRQTKCDVREEIFKIVDIQRLIQYRFSINLMLSISTDFFLIIVSLFWIFVRIVFHFLKTHEGKSNRENI